MDVRTAPECLPSSDVVEFVRFCYQRRRVGWPELYDEMCAVASRGLFRGWHSDDLAARGIGFSLFELPSLAAVVSTVVAEEHRQRTLAVKVRAQQSAGAGEEDAGRGRADEATEASIPGSLSYAGAG